MLGSTNSDRRLLYPEASQLSAQSTKTLGTLINQATYDISILRKNGVGRDRITKATRYLHALTSERDSRAN